MPFYENFLEQCVKKKISPSAAAKAVGLSGAAATGWKNGKVPFDATIVKLADYFGCTPDDLLSEEKQKPVLPDGLPDDVAELVMRYLAAPPAQKQLVLQALRAFEQVQLSQDLADD